MRGRLASLALGSLLLSACGGGGGGGAPVTPSARIGVADATLDGPDRTGILDFALLSDEGAALPTLLQFDLAYDAGLLTTDANVDALQPVTVAAHVVRPGQLRVVVGDIETTDGAAAPKPGPLFRLAIRATPTATAGETIVSVLEQRAADAVGDDATFDAAAATATVTIP